MTPIEWGFAAVFAAGCLTGAGIDIVQRRIPNLLCLGLFLAGTAYAVTQTGAGAWPWHLLSAVTCLIGGAVLFRFGMIGAGDAKFLAAVAVWFTLGAVPFLLAAIAISGLGVFAAWFIYRRMRGIKISRPGGSPFDELPYGAAICTGALYLAFGV